MYDVMVIGAGPGGSMAARKCAQAGLKTVIVERAAKLPRRKACGGLLVPECVAVIEREIGKVPTELYVTPPLRGFYSHGVKVEEADAMTILNPWRKDIDNWFTENAIKAGAEIMLGTLFTGFAVEKDRIVVSLRREGKEAKEEAKVLIGADGSSSVVRQLLYPDINFSANLRRSYRPHYQGTIDIDLEWCHLWMGKEWGSVYAPLVPKGDMMILGSSGSAGEDLKERAERFKEFLTRKYGFHGAFLFAEGCADQHALAGEVLAGKGNVMLVGDAAGLIREYGEGIFPALTSGLEAAKAAAQALASGRTAVEIFAEPMKGIADEAKQSITNWLGKHQKLIAGMD